MGPTLLALSTSEGKARGPEPWPLNPPIVLFIPFYKGGVVPMRIDTRTKPYIQPTSHMAQSQHLDPITKTKHVYIVQSVISHIDILWTPHFRLMRFPLDDKLDFCFEKL